jgi:hypothetical protein
MRILDSGCRKFNEHPVSSIQHPASSPETPRLGQIKGGESTQAIGASFWLERAANFAAAIDWVRKKKCPGSAVPGGKDRSSHLGIRLASSWKKYPGLGGPGGKPAQAV